MALRISLVLVIAIAILQMAEAQPFGNPLSFNLLGVPITLYCTPDGNINVFGAAAPPFKGAKVELQCGNNEIIANVTTDSLGIGYLITKPQPVLPFFPPQDNCMLVVSTVQSDCNNTLGGLLESGLKFIGTSLFGNLKIANFAPTGFRYKPSQQ